MEETDGVLQPHITRSMFVKEKNPLLVLSMVKEKKLRLMKKVSLSSMKKVNQFMK